MADCPSLPEDARAYIDATKERKRQKEVYKYLSSTILSSFPTAPNASSPSPYTPISAQLSRDPILNGLSQLGALRLGCDRSFISLLDTHHQFIVAETTRSTPLYQENLDPSVPNIAFGAGTIDVSLAVCLNTLPVFIHTDGRFNVETENVSATPTRYIIRDFTKHEYFQARPYVTEWPYYRFYFEVPLFSPGGVVVGSYCVVHNETRPDPDSKDFEVMKEISSAIVQHLELLRVQEEHAQAFRLLKGLELFVQGEDSLRQWYLQDYTSKLHENVTETPEEFATREFGLRHEGDSQAPSPTNVNKGTSLETASDQGLSTPQEDDPSPPSQSTSATSVSPLPGKANESGQGSFPISEQKASNATEDFRASATSKGISEPQSVEALGDGKVPHYALVLDEIQASFSRATNLLRESMDLEGVVCFDGCPRSFGSLVPDSSLISEPGSCLEDSDEIAASDHASKTSNVEYDDDRGADRLGFSTRAKSSLANNALSGTYYSIPERDLQYLIHKYPRGYIFQFDEAGALSPSDDSTSEDITKRKPRGAQKRRKGPRFPISDLRNWFPAARGIIFLPLWAAKSETCLAACFGWSTEATRTFSIRDLTYFTTFGRSITGEVSRLEMLSSVRAKSDFISSVSHELRSPLHGILGSAEMLREICSEQSQIQMVSMIQNCGMSLLETMNHILDYSKINTLVRQYGNRKLRKVGDPERTGVIEKVSEFDMSSLVEDVVEATLTAHRFKLSTTSSYNLRGIQDVPATTTELAETVRVILALDWKDTWLVRSEAGAWRRILINLLGNALKYTSKGHIKVSLQHAKMGKSKSDITDQNRTLVFLSVKDTGQGISPSYLRQHLFQPFVQEDVLSSGTGLGLSIVKQLVDSLGGTIEVWSEVGVGTEVTVSVPLACCPTTKGALPPNISQLPKHGDLKVCLLAMDMDSTVTNDLPDAASGMLTAQPRTMLTLKSVLTSHFDQWFNASVMATPTVEDARGDIVLVPEEHLQLSTPARRKFLDCLKGSFIIILSDQIPTAFNYESDDSVHFLGAPYGPRQLSKILETFSFRRSDANSAPSFSTLSPAAQRPEKLTELILHNTSETTNTSPLQYPVGPTVLLVDDNPVNLKMLVMYMTKLKVEHLTATNGLEAVEAYRAADRAIDYVLMDISMPVMDGLTATREIRAFEIASHRKRSVIAALTGLGSAQAQQEAYSSGVDIFLAKPVAMKTIKELVSGGVSGSATQQIVSGRPKARGKV